MKESNSNFVSTLAGIQMPGLIYGTAWKKERTEDLVVRAVELGFRGIDTACQPKHYNEAGVGNALKRLEQQGITREQIFIQTKFTPLGGHDPQQIPYDPSAPLSQQVLQSFAVSQKNLGTPYVDSLVLHSPLADHKQLMTVWRTMESIQQKGGAKQLGISNCYQLKVMTKLFEEAEVKPAVLQNRFYRETGYDRELRAWCQSQGMIYQSFWTLTANPHILEHSLVKSLAKEYQKTTAQIFFRYLTQIGIVPLTGTTSNIHMEEDLMIFDFQLRQEEMQKFESLL